MLPWFVYSVLSDGRKVLVARFATRMMAADFVDLQKEISGDQYVMERSFMDS